MSKLVICHNFDIFYSISKPIFCARCHSKQFSASSIQNVKSGGGHWAAIAAARLTLISIFPPFLVNHVQILFTLRPKIAQCPVVLLLYWSSAGRCGRTARRRPPRSERATAYRNSKISYAGLFFPFYFLLILCPHLFNTKLLWQSLGLHSRFILLVMHVYLYIK